MKSDNAQYAKMRENAQIEKAQIRLLRAGLANAGKNCQNRGGANKPNWK